MPRRDDLESILLIGSGPIVIGQACEFDYSGTQACRVLREEGYRVILANSNPATIMTDPDFADATYVEPLTADVLERIIAKERPDAVLPTLGGQTALNLAMELDANGVLEAYGAELIGADAEAISTAEDREKFKQAMVGIGLGVPASRHRAHDRGVPRLHRGDRAARGDPPGLHPGRQGHRHRRHARGVRDDGHPWPRGQPDLGDPDREVDRRMEGVRARGHARRGGQLRDHLLDREPGPDGRPHRRFDHRRTRPDADRRRVPADARRRVRLHPACRGRDRRIERAVRGAPRDRRAGRHRDEPTRQPLLGAGVQGHGLPDRQDRREARRGLHAGRDPQRHHQEDPGQLRADASTTW